MRRLLLLLLLQVPKKEEVRVCVCRICGNSAMDFAGV